MITNNRIQASVENGIARLLLDKPARLNALDGEMLEAIERLVGEWEATGVTVLIVGSTSRRTFCVGADLAVLARMNEATMREWEMLGHRVLDHLEHSPLISVASISGYCLGGGLTLATACDFRIAADTAQFGQPEIGLGWIPGWGGVERLARAIGVNRAKELCMTGRRIDAADAERIGLVDRVAPAADLERQTSEFAALLAGQSRAALQTIKAIANRGRTAFQMLDAFANATLLNDPRGQAAIQRFLEKSK